MKILVSTLLFFSFFSGFSQILPDTGMMKALGPVGYRDTRVAFKQFQLSSIDGNGFTDDSLKNKVTFINFWFEACAPCIAEFEALNDLYRKYSSHENFRFLSFTFETPEAARLTVEKYQLAFPVICVDKAAIYDLLFQLGFPTSMVTDRAGVISFVKCGGPNEADHARLQVDTLFSREIERQLYSR